MIKICRITNNLHSDDKSEPGADEHHMHSSERAYMLEDINREKDEQSRGSSRDTDFIDSYLIPTT